jgi:hypothetical protein
MAKKSQWDTAVIDVNQKKVAKQVLSNKKPLRDS